MQDTGYSRTTIASDCCFCLTGMEPDVFVFLLFFCCCSSFDSRFDAFLLTAVVECLFELQ